MFGLMAFSQFLKLFDRVPRAPMITGMTLALLQFPILISSHFKSLYLSSFSFSFSCILISNGQATSIIIQVPFVCQGLQCKVYYASALYPSVSCSPKIFLPSHFLPQTLAYAHITSLHRINRLLYTIPNVLLWQ